MSQNSKAMSASSISPRPRPKPKPSLKSAEPELAEAGGVAPGTVLVVVNGMIELAEGLAVTVVVALAENLLGSCDVPGANTKCVVVSQKFWSWSLGLRTPSSSG